MSSPLPAEAPEDRNTMQAFFDAVKTGDAARAAELLNAHPRILSARNDSGQSAVLLAIYYGKKAILDLLLARGAQMDIYEAAAAGKVERVAALVQANPGLVNSYAPDGFTPLGLGAFFGHREVVEFLLERGAEVNAVARNATGYTALTGAVARGDAEIVALLLTRGANAGYRYAQGYSPLHEAAAGGKVEIVRLLLDHGADPNARSDDGKTPLARAVEKGHHEVATLLRQRGASA